MVKFSIKDIRTISMTSLRVFIVKFEHIFTPSFSIFIVYFEPVMNDCRDCQEF